MRKFILGLCNLLLMSWGAILLAVPAFGFCLQPDPSIACEFLNSDAVFIGTVISVKVTPAEHDFDDGWTYKLSVQRVYRGPNRKVISVFTENNSGRFPLKMRNKYLLFATKVDGRFAIYGCGNSSLVSGAVNTISELSKLRIPRDVEIEGRISFSGVPDSGPHIAGVGVTIRGKGRKYSATSDKDGWFRLQVPPGQYSAEIQQIPHWNIVPYDLSFNNPRNFVAKRERCVGLQFVGSPE